LSGVRRPNPQKLLLDLTRRLAEEFETVPIPTVTSAVRAAASATALFGDDIESSLETIEKIAREDLLAVRAAAAEQAQVALAS
jgi:phage-related minor tail protein